MDLSSQATRKIAFMHSMHALQLKSSEADFIDKFLPLSDIVSSESKETICRFSGLSLMVNAKQPIDLDYLLN